VLRLLTNQPVSRLDNGLARGRRRRHVRGHLKPNRSGRICGRLAEQTCTENGDFARHHRQTAAVNDFTGMKTWSAHHQPNILRVRIDFPAEIT